LVLPANKVTANLNRFPGPVHGPVHGKPIPVPPNLEHNPTVVFIGDDLTADWKLPYPLWINKGVAGETSGQTLARFQHDVIDLHPDIVHIETGMNDYTSADWIAPCGVNVPLLIQTCSNLISMINMADAANILVIVGTIPYPGEDGALYDRNLVLAGELLLGENTTLIDYEPLMYQCVCTDNGIVPNTLGYYQMDQAALSAIQGLEVPSN
jgi:hypothetical protein